MALEPYFSKRVITSSLYYRMVIYVEDSNATISEVLANLQSIFSGVESLGKAVEFGDKVAVPIYQFNFGTGAVEAVAAVKDGRTTPSRLDSAEQSAR